MELLGVLYQVQVITVSQAASCCEQQCARGFTPAFKDEELQIPRLHFIPRKCELCCLQRFEFFYMLSFRGWFVFVKTL